MKDERRKERKHLCAGCGTRQARYRYHGQVKSDRTHVLCFQCYRAIRDSQRLAHPSTFPLQGDPVRPAPRTRSGRTGTND